MQTGVKITVGFKIKELCHLRAGGVLEGGALNDGDLARLAVSRGVAALYALGSDALFGHTDVLPKIKICASIKRFFNLCNIFRFLLKKVIYILKICGIISIC